MRWIGLIVMGFMMLTLGGCLERLATFALSPTSGVIDTLDDAGQSMSASVLAPNNAQAMNDIDRILAENPQTANREELERMRSQLAGQQTAGGVTAGTTTANRSMRRQMAIDRTLTRRRSDSLHRMTVYEAQRLVPFKPISPVIPVTGTVFGEAEVQHLSDYSPVRMR